MPRRKPALAALLLLHLLQISPGCGRQHEQEARGDAVLVFAASSLADVLPRVAQSWRTAGGAGVETSFDATSRLASQIAAGAPADVFFSADREWMDHLERRGRVEPATRVDLLGNELVIAVRRGSNAGIREPVDLLGSGVTRVALAGDAVPAGKYAQAAFTKLGIWSALGPRVVRAHDVRSALAWLAQGEVDAAVVYRTDVLAEPHAQSATTLPAWLHPPIVYPIAVVGGSRHTEAARRFVDFCAGTAARRIFEAAGFHVLGEGA